MTPQNVATTGVQREYNNNNLNRCDSLLFTTAPTFTTTSFGTQQQQRDVVVGSGGDIGNESNSDTTTTTAKVMQHDDDDDDDDDEVDVVHMMQNRQQSRQEQQKELSDHQPLKRQRLMNDMAKPRNTPNIVFYSIHGLGSEPLDGAVDVPAHSTLQNICDRVWNDNACCFEKHSIAKSQLQVYAITDKYFQHPLKKLNVVVWDPNNHGGGSESSDEPLTFFIDQRIPYVPCSESGQQAGQLYVDALMSPNAIQNVVGTSGGMRVICNLPSMWEGQPSINVIIRQVTEPFWNACIDICEDPAELNLRVCAIGSPGIGKSASTHYLIRMLLLRNKTVVYLIRSKSLSSQFYEFVPQPENPIQPYQCRVYNETQYPDPNVIPSLQDQSTYYIVDSCDTMDSCSPDDTFEPRVIIVTTPEPDHWGGSEFFKSRDDIAQVDGGELLYYSLWSLEELILAKSYITHLSKDVLDDAAIEHRYNQVGGVPRHIFATYMVYRMALWYQKRVIAELSREQAKSIVQGTLPPVGMITPSCPKSEIIGYESVPGNAFDIQNGRIISGRIAKKYM